MRNPPVQVTVICGLLILALILTVGLNVAERGLSTLLGAGPHPSTIYFSRCAPGIYDLALFGMHRRIACALPLGRIAAVGRTVTVSFGERAFTVNLAPAWLAPGEIDRAWQTLRTYAERTLGGAGAVFRRLMQRT